MSGMILGTLFGSVSTFLQVIMDPNEYDLLQGDYLQVLAISKASIFCLLL